MPWCCFGLPLIRTWLPSYDLGWELHHLTCLPHPTPPSWGPAAGKKSLKKVTKPPHIWTFSSGASVMHLVRRLCTPGLRIWHLPPPGAGKIGRAHV